MIGVGLEMQTNASGHETCILYCICAAESSPFSLPELPAETEKAERVSQFSKSHQGRRGEEKRMQPH